MTLFDTYRDLESLSRHEILRVQEDLFRKHLRHCAEHTPFYRDLFTKDRLAWQKLGLEDIARIPLTRKSDLEARNDDFLAVPLSAVSDIVLSSGTTGRPTRMMYTVRDLDRLAYNERIAFERIGMTSSDTVLLTCTMDRCFIAGLAYYEGARAMGAATIRNGLSTPASHYEIIQRLSPTVIVGVPSFLYKLGGYLRERGTDPATAGVRMLVGIGEPVRDRSLALLPKSREMESMWQAPVYSTYASSEIVTTFCECRSQRGGHLHPSLGIVEVVDDAGVSLPAGQVGEVVVTPLLVEGMPLLRFATGDVSFLMDEPCSCGRSSVRLGPILGRKKQMLKLHGTTLYPQAIFATLDEIPEVGEYFVRVREESALSDHVEVHVATKRPIAVDTILERLQARLRVKPTVIVAPEEDIRKTVYVENSRKPIRFLDLRG